MKGFFSLLLIGSLSMLLAEVLSGSSRIWFVDPWSLVVTFPLYLFHILFFMWIACKRKKISLSQLYLLGVLFGLYEAWITKVLWSGYTGSTEPLFGTVLGIGLIEYPVLIFFWHPIMSFILPILVFQILSRKAYVSHEPFLVKSSKKTWIATLFIVTISTFLVNGNHFNVISALISFIGSVILIGILWTFAKTDLKIFEFSKKRFFLVSLFMALLYIAGFILIVPEKLPLGVLPYITIIVSYLIAFFLFVISKKSKMAVTPLSKKHYSVFDLLKFSAIMVVAILIASISQPASMVVFAITYSLLILIGVFLFFKVAVRVLLRK